MADYAPTSTKTSVWLVLGGLAVVIVLLFLIIAGGSGTTTSDPRALGAPEVAPAAPAADGAAATE